MKKLRLTMILFAILIALPLAWVAWRTYGSLNRESASQVRFFAERLLDEIETELAERVRREENRAVDEYRHQMVQSGKTIISPLAKVPDENYILGYFQNNPDGSFQTPLIDDPKDVPSLLMERVAQLEAVNQRFNQRKRKALPPLLAAKAPVPVPVAPITEKAQADFADRFLKTRERKKADTALGQKQTRVEEITADQAMNLAQQERTSLPPATRQLGIIERETVGSMSETRARRALPSYAEEGGGPSNTVRPTFATPVSGGSCPPADRGH